MMTVRTERGNQGIDIPRSPERTLNANQMPKGSPIRVLRGRKRQSSLQWLPLDNLREGLICGGSRPNM